MWRRPRIFCVREVADMWKISKRRIQILYREERIDGAKKFDRSWAIPRNVDKPVDGRITTGEYRNWRKKTAGKRYKLDT